MRRPLILAAAFLPLLTGGCASLDSLKAEVSGERTYSTVPNRFFDVAYDRRVPAAGGSGMTAIAATLSGKPDGSAARGLDGRDPLPPGTQELRGAEPLLRYAETILTRLLKSWPHAKPPVRIVITNNPAYVAEAVPENTILLSQGVFVNATSEDELAFILAHEVSHFLLNHLDADRHHAAQKTVEDSAVGTLLKAVPHSTPQGGRNALLAYAAYRTFQDIVAHPSWTRLQEDQADLLGLDLLEKANYSISVYQTVMQRFASDARKQQAKAEEQRKRFETEITALAESGQVAAGINAAFDKLGNAPAELVNGIVTQLKSEHNSAERRSEDLDSYALREQLFEASARPLSVSSYEKTVFQGAAQRALARSVLSQRADSLIVEGRLNEAEALLKEVSKGGFDADPELRMSFYRLHVKQGRMDLALKDLEVAVRSSAAPREAFDFLVAEYRSAGRFSQALTTLDQKERRFGGAESNYPMRIRLLVDAGRLQEAGDVVERCRALRGHPLMRECNAVWEETRLASARSPAVPKR